MRRVIICCIGISFPRGDAKANYMQYVSDALTAEGYQVELLVSTNPEYSEAQSFSYHGAHVRNIFIPTKSRILHSLLNGKLFWKRVSHMLEGYGLTDQDVIMAGTCMEKIVARLKKKYHFKTIGWPLEWFGPEQYATEKQREKGEWEFRSNANKDLLFPISHYIAKQFEKDPCKILILPIMADTQEVPYVPKNLDEKYSFIFPANGRMKDSLGGILKGLASLDESDLKKLTFHLTGVKEETVRDILTPKEFAQLDGTLVIHKWMQYEELVKLYQRDRKSVV